MSREVRGGTLARSREHRGRAAGEEAGRDSQRHRRDHAASRDLGGDAANRFSDMVGVLLVELHIPTARSLKEKRAAIRPILDVARTRYRVAISEVGYQDLHQRAMLEVAAVASAQHVVTETLDAVERLVWSMPAAEVVATSRRWLEDG
ncbi:MAG: DUF503 domain-containing protein [Acidimicrobiales bacterium]